MTSTPIPSEAEARTIEPCPFCRAIPSLLGGCTPQRIAHPFVEAGGCVLGGFQAPLALWNTRATLPPQDRSEAARELAHKLNERFFSLRPGARLTKADLVLIGQAHEALATLLPQDRSGDALDWRGGLRDAFSDKSTLATLAMGVNNGAYPLTDHGPISWSDWLVEVIESYARKRPVLSLSQDRPEGARWRRVRDTPEVGGTYVVGGYVERGGLPHGFERTFATCILLEDGPSWSHRDDSKSYIPIEWWFDTGPHPEHPAALGSQDRPALDDERLADIAQRNAGAPTLVIYHEGEWDILGATDLAYQEGVLLSIPLADLPLASRPAPDGWVLPVAFPYQRTFDAIAAATSASGGHIAISVRKFQEAFNAAAPSARRPARIWNDKTKTFDHPPSGEGVVETVAEAISVPIMSEFDGQAADDARWCHQSKIDKDKLREIARLAIRALKGTPST